MFFWEELEKKRYDELTLLIDREYSKKTNWNENISWPCKSRAEGKNKSMRKKATRRYPDRSKGEPGSRTEIVPARKEDGSRADGPENDQHVKKLKPSDSRIHNVEYKTEFALRKKFNPGRNPESQFEKCSVEEFCKNLIISNFQFYRRRNRNTKN